MDRRRRAGRRVNERPPRLVVLREVSMLKRPALALLLLATPFAAHQLAAQPPADEALPKAAVARLGTTRLRLAGVPNTHTIAAVAYSPDGATLATTAGYGGVVLWDAATGARLRQIDISESYVYGLAFSADGKRLAYVANAGVVNNGVLDLVAGKKLWQSPGGTFAAFLPDGTVLAFNDKGRPAVLEADSGKLVRELFDPQAQWLVQSLTLARDGKSYAAVVQVREPQNTYYSGFQLHLGDPATGKRRQLDVPVGQYSQVALSPDGSMLTVAEAKTLTVVNTATGKVVHKLASETSSLFAGSLFSPDGKTVVAVAAFYEPEKLAQQRTVLRLLDAASAKEQGRVEAPPQVVGLTFAPDGKRLAGVGCGFAPCIFDLTTLQPVPTFDGHRFAVRYLRFAPDGKTLLSGDRETGVLCWDIAGRKVLSRLAVGAVLAMDLFPDGKTLAVHNAAKRLSVVDAATSKLRFELAEFCSAVLVAPDGKTLVRAEYGGVLVFHDAANGKEVRQLKAHKSDVHDLCFSADSRVLLSSSRSRPDYGMERSTAPPPVDDSVRAWDVAAGKQLACWEVPVACIALSPDGKLAAAGRVGGDVLVWNVAKGKLVRTLPVGVQVRALAFSPDGRTLAVAGDDAIVRLYETETGGERRQLRGHSAAVESLAWSPDSRLLASGSGDTTIVVWAVNK
jgi:WD40 repeat protein